MVGRSHLASTLVACWVLCIQSTCQMLYFHAPKTSSTFCLSMQHACDESNFASQVAGMREVKMRSQCAQIVPNGTWVGNMGHEPVKNRSKLKHMVGLFREPYSRFVSSFNDALHSEGMAFPEKDRIRSTFMPYPIRNATLWPIESEFVASEKSACVHNFNIWGGYPANKGCYVKMLNGHQCHENVTITPTMVVRATSHLKKFLFVGLFEEYTKTVGVFLKFVKTSWDRHPIHVPANRREDISMKKPPEMKPFPVELERFRADSSVCREHLQQARRQGLLLYSDPYDSEVYKLAQSMWAEAKEEYDAQAE